MSFEKALSEELDKVMPGTVFPVIAPKGTATPYCAYVSSYGERDYTLDGFLTSREIEVGIHIVSSTYVQMKQFTNTIMDSLLALEGQTMGTDGIRVQAIQCEDQPDEIIDQTTYEYHSFIELTFRI